jgi:hypothetical protein
MHLNNPLGKALTVFVMLAFILASCTSYKLINRQPEALHTELDIGDSVKIVTKDGRHLQFQIVEIRADSLFSEQHQIAFGEIVKIEKQKVDAAKTTGAVLLGSVGIISLAFLIFAITWEDTWADFLGD